MSSNKRISELTALAGVSVSSDDLIPIVDVSASILDRTKRITIADLGIALGTAPGAYQPIDATLTALAGQNWTANSVPLGAGADAVSQLLLTSNTFLARASTGNAAAKIITDFGLDLVDSATALQAQTTLGIVPGGTYSGKSLMVVRVNAAETALELATVSGGGGGAWGSITGTLSSQSDLQSALDAKQGLDATLTALAGANWATNSLAVGSGSDTVAQVTFAANTFPGRGSSGNLVAKTLSDFALTFLDDADAAAVRTTIGAGTSSFSGAFSALSGVPTTLAGYGISDAQGLDAALTSLAGGSDFVQFAGPSGSTKVFTLPNSSETLLYSGGPLGTPSSGVGTNLTGTASGLTAGNVTTNANLTGPVTSVGNATTIAAGVVTEAMQVLADNTTANVSTTKHGYAPKAPNDATKFLDGTGAYSTPAGGGNVSNTGTPTSGQAAEWTSATVIQGVAVTGSGSYVKGTAPTVAGGSITGLTALAIRDTSAAFDVTLAAVSSTTLTAGRTLTLDVANAARTLKLTGNPTIADWFDQSVKAGASPTFVTVTAALAGNATTASAVAVGGITGLGTGVATALAVNVGSAGAFVTFNGAGGTPSSLTLTNATSLPVAGITASTSTALGVGSVELGHATDTTIARVSAGVVSIEGVNIVMAGAATASGLTMATARLLGRTTASTGAIEEITVGTGLSLSAGSLTATGGSGTVTNTGGNLTSNAIVLGAGTVDTKVVAGIITDGTSVITLGVNTTTIGKIKFFGNTSGDATIQPAAVAGTATVLTLPAATGTLATLAGTETFSGKTLTAPKFVDGGFIADANGNELVIFNTTASAVNEITITNGASGTPAQLSASGGGASLDFWVMSKGAAKFRYSQGSDPTKECYLDVSGSATNGLTVLKFNSTGSRNVSFPDATTNLVGDDTTNTLANKTMIATTNVVEQITSTTSSATPTPTGGSLQNLFTVTAQAATATVGAPTGSPVHGNRLTMAFKASGTQSISFNATYVFIGCTAPNSLVDAKWVYLFARYNSTAAKWHVLAVTTEV